MEYVQDFTSRILPNLRDVLLWFMVVAIFAFAAVTHGKH